MKVVCMGRREVAPGAWEYTFRPEAPLEYVPGQYARFTFLSHLDDPRDKQYRTFSLTSHPSEGVIRFIVRLDQPLSVFKGPLSELQPGDQMHMSEPLGDTILPRLSTTPLVFVAQGIAIASYISMLNECARSNLSHPVSLVWTRRRTDSALSELIPEGAQIVSRVDKVYPDRLTIDHITELLAPGGLLYLSGSQTFVETLGDALEASGTPRERIIYDYYEGYTEL